MIDIMIITLSLVYIIGVVYLASRPVKRGNYTGVTEQLFYTLGYVIAILSWPILIIASMFNNE